MSANRIDHVNDKPPRSEERMRELVQQGYSEPGWYFWEDHLCDPGLRGPFDTREEAEAEEILLEFLKKHPWQSEFASPNWTCPVCGCMISGDHSAQRQHAVWHDGIEYQNRRHEENFVTAFNANAGARR